MTLAEHNESNWTLGALKEHYDRLLNEREERYIGMFKAEKEARIAAQESAEKAILKSEASLEDYKKGANEIRAALNDYQSNTMPRKETEGRFQSVQDLVESKFDSVKNSADGLAKLISALQISEGRGEGGSSAKNRFTITTVAITGLVLTSIALLIGFITLFLKLK